MKLYFNFMPSRYSDWLRAGRSGDRIPVEARFSAPVQTGSGSHPASCTLGTGSFPRVKSGRNMTMTPHPLLVPWSRKSTATPLLPIWAVRPVQSLSACTNMHFTLTFHAKSRQYWTDMKRIWANPVISFSEKKLQTNKMSFEFCVILCNLCKEYKTFCTLGVIILFKKSNLSLVKSVSSVSPRATEGNWSEQLIIHYTAVISVSTSLLN